jgi:hypothetical protein
VLPDDGYLAAVRDVTRRATACCSSSTKTHTMRAVGVADAIAAHGPPWHVQRLGCRAEYWFCPPPRDP